MLAWLCLPIVMNGASHLLMHLGLDRIGRFAFEWRYMSILGTVPSFLASAVLLSMTGGSNRRSTGGTPPSSSSPSGRAGSRNPSVPDTEQPGP